MPRRSILSAAERESLLALPDTKDELIRHYTFSESDLSIIRQRRGSANRLGFAVQLSYLRFPGIILGVDQSPFPPLLKLIADQLKVGVESWDEYGQREQTRREHLIELQTVFGFQTFTMSHYRQAVRTLTELAMQTDKGVVLADAVIDHLQRQSIILPALNAIERICAEAITRANRRIYDALVDPLSDAHRRRLDDLLKRRESAQFFICCVQFCAQFLIAASISGCRSVPSSGCSFVCIDLKKASEATLADHQNLSNCIVFDSTKTEVFGVGRPC